MELVGCTKKIQLVPWNDGTQNVGDKYENQQELFYQELRLPISRKHSEQKINVILLSPSALHIGSVKL